MFPVPKFPFSINPNQPSPLRGYSTSGGRVTGNPKQMRLAVGHATRTLSLC
ncbi:MAG: hypothetical protein F6J98_23025 [Moorea sp. SIO4G2]|nr:hypothetical protein [Moorena sp. SIO4A3]NEO63154.1 hypothetical protein [Moorena sp. SIO4G2]